MFLLFTIIANNESKVSNNTVNTSISSIQVAQDKSTTVWVSKNNGKVYHFYKGCSGMKNPVQMMLEEAQGKGLRACKKCGK